MSILRDSIRTPLILVGLGAALLMSRQLEAQVERREAFGPDAGAFVALLQDSGSCGDCIRMVHSTTIGEEDGPGYLSQTQWATRDHLGRIWVLQSWGPNVYDESGEFVRSIGRQGEGPGEFKQANDIYTDAYGLVHVFDVANLRQTVYSPDFSIHLDRRLDGGVNDAAPMPGTDRFAANMFTLSRDRFGYSMHVVDAGRVTASFGIVAKAGPSMQLRRIAVGPDGRVYTAHYYKYEIEVWSPEGTRLNGFSRNLWESRLNPETERPYGLTRHNLHVNAGITGIHVDADGLLWVVAWIPKDGYQEHLVERRTPDGNLSIRWNTPEDIFTTLIEVVDPIAGVVVASVSLPDQLVSAFLDDRTVYGPDHTDDGVPRVSVSTIEVDPRLFSVTR